MAWRKPATLNEWLAVGAKRWTLFVFPALAVMVVVCIASFKVERVYQAEARFQRKNDVTMSDSQEGGMGGSALDSIRMSYQQDLRGKAPVGQLIDDLGLTKNLPHAADGSLTSEGQIQKNDLIRSVQSRLSLSYQNNTELQDDITVTFADPDRDLAPRVVNQLIENYIRKTKQELNEVLLNAKIFFDKESQRYRGKMQELEEKKLRFGAANPGMLPDDPASVKSRLIEARSQLTTSANEAEVTKEKLAALGAWVQAQPEFIDRPVMGENPAYRELINRKTAVENELDVSLSTFRRTEDHPAIISARARLIDIDKKLATTAPQIELSRNSETNQPRNDAMREIQTLRGALTALERQRDELIAQVEQYEVLDRNFYISRNEYAKMERELEEATSQATFWEDKLRSTQIALSAEFSQKGMRLTFEQRADIARPSKPTMFMVIAAALVLGAGVGVLMLVVSELLDTSFRNADQAMDDLKLPVLGAVSEIVSPAQNFRRRILNYAIYPGVATVMVVILLVNFWLIYLSLEDTLRFEQLVSSPGTFIKQTLSGRG